MAADKVKDLTVSFCAGVKGEKVVYWKEYADCSGRIFIEEPINVREFTNHYFEKSI